MHRPDCVMDGGWRCLVDHRKGEHGNPLMAADGLYRKGAGMKSANWRVGTRGKHGDIVTYRETADGGREYVQRETAKRADTRRRERAAAVKTAERKVDREHVERFTRRTMAELGLTSSQTVVTD